MGHWGADARPGDVSLWPATRPFVCPLPIAHSLTALPLLCSQARWRRGEAVSMMSAREQMLSFEQLQYLPKPKI